MTAEERFARIEEKHAALAESVEILSGLQRATERNLDRLTVRLDGLTGNVERLVSVVEEVTALV
jgi:hypothetical protein